MRGGARTGAGRKKGGANRVTQKAIEQAKETGILPLDYLLSVMRDAEANKSQRIDCAKAAAQYLHAKLQPIDGNGSSAQRVVAEGVFSWQPPQ